MFVCLRRSKDEAPVSFERDLKTKTSIYFCTLPIIRIHLHFVYLLISQFTSKLTTQTTVETCKIKPNYYNITDHFQNLETVIVPFCPDRCNKANFYGIPATVA